MRQRLWQRDAGRYQRGGLLCSRGSAIFSSAKQCRGPHRRRRVFLAIQYYRSQSPATPSSCPFPARIAQLPLEFGSCISRGLDLYSHQFDQDRARVDTRDSGAVSPSFDAAETRGEACLPDELLQGGESILPPPDASRRSSRSPGGAGSFVSAGLRTTCDIAEIASRSAGIRPVRNRRHRWRFLLPPSPQPVTRTGRLGVRTL